MDKKALWKIEYGLFVLFTHSDDRDNGCIINTFVQLTSEPMTAMLSVNKANLSRDFVNDSGICNVSVLSKDAPFDIIKRFGYQSGKTADKLNGYGGVKRAENGVLRLDEYSNAYLSLKITGSADMHTHTVFFAEITDCEVLSDKESMSYSYYQSNVKPQSRPQPEGPVWRCTVCGYEYKGEYLPEDFICPICKHGASDFEKVGGNTGNDIKETRKEEKKTMKKWKCTICGEIVISEERPDKCPLCKAPGEKFVEVVEEEKTWATEHVIGIAKDAPQEIIDGLRANFTGECSEVGMYLAMSRAAAREGFPEIAEYWKTAAFEEAEHAAKFAELLGEVVSPSTEENLRVRVEAENGATSGKFELAKKAKALNLDAIHDTVHEMAKDEARHGKAFEGLLKRYFGK